MKQAFDKLYKDKQTNAWLKKRVELSRARNLKRIVIRILK